MMARWRCFVVLTYSRSWPPETDTRAVFVGGGGVNILLKIENAPEIHIVWTLAHELLFSAFTLYSLNKIHTKSPERDLT